jgi:hypothetical protein
MRSAMRTVEKRCEISSAILPSVSSAKRSKTSSSLRASRAAVGSSRISKLRVAKVGAGKGHLLPLAAGEFDAAFEAAAEHLIVAAASLLDDGVGKALVSGEFDVALLMRLVDAAYGDVLSRAVISKRMKS